MSVVCLALVLVELGVSDGIIVVRSGVLLVGVAAIYGVAVA